MKPRVTVRKKGEAAKPPSPADEAQLAALKAAADTLVRLCPAAKLNATQIAEWVITAHILKLCEVQHTEPSILKALTSERPWDLMRLIDKTREEEAAILSALPAVGDIVAEMDPSGTKPLFAYSKDEIVRMFEAVIWCWEESKSARSKIGALDDTIPF
ncbi:MAG: hypothetical protein RLZ51_1880 [Pseudomonadota bacterium]